MVPLGETEMQVTVLALSTVHREYPSQDDETEYDALLNVVNDDDIEGIVHIRAVMPDESREFDSRVHASREELADTDLCELTEPLFTNEEIAWTPALRARVAECVFASEENTF
jgi:hypothetical protein